MPQLFCILEEGGRALLTRAQGDIQAPSFPTVGLLSSIATYTENTGHELRVIASTNVRVVYRRFENHLLFVLVTSNLLLHTELLQLHLQTISDALLLLLGPAPLVLDTTARIDGLKKTLRAPTVQRAVDSLIADDTLVPCILLPVPQAVGLPLRDKATLQAALARVASAVGCQHAALISEGYYLAATHSWWSLLSPREQVLVQHLVAQGAVDQSGEAPAEVLLHLFVSIVFDLALVVEHSPPSATLLWGHRGTALQQGFNPLMSPTLRKQMGTSASPMSYRPPSGPREDSLPAGGDGLQLFFRSAVDTLVSFVLQTWPQMPPALQAALHDRTGGEGAHRQGAAQQRPSAASPSGAPSPLQPQPAASASTSQRPPHGSPRSSRLGASTAIPAMRRLSTSAASSPVGSASRLQAMFGRSGASGTADAAAVLAPAAGGEEGTDLGHVSYEEVHAVIEGARLMALLDRGDPAGDGGGGAAGSHSGGAAGGPDRVDVFMAFPRRVGRAAALEAATTLRATYLMAYHGE
ncbi:Protein fuzzy [Tetrabaena socialis]|uniref:Protein fuzzy n=1 Tax=Tetrabaena socialis TaxID=47790 RepID=A0A2J8AIW2_9CHLO|nr:Protein fuzzy [Tetrabaena socialis]|eukprot:PNH12466.1 Protein fuzzy [Tetrabaena socialis]